jgi:hypothetical protein
VSVIASTGCISAIYVPKKLIVGLFSVRVGKDLNGGPYSKVNSGHTRTELRYHSKFPDSTPPDVSLWGILNEKFVRNPTPSNLRDLLQNTKHVLRSKLHDTTRNIFGNLKQRMDLYFQRDHFHVGHALYF